MKYVKFTGKFKDLIPNGWEFCKLYARNYRQYHKTCDGERYSQGCRIWQHLGGYLEIADLFELSSVLVQQIKDGKIKEWESQSRWAKKTEPVYWFLIDMEEGRFIPYCSPEYRKLKDQQYTFADLDTDERKEAYDVYFERYREFNMRNELVDMIQDLLDKGWIEVCENNGKIYDNR